ncbi:unnamed protein product [Caenorhabditis nigoni]
MVKRQPKKRKHEQCKENVSPQKKKMNREEVKLVEKDWMPAAAVEFFKSEKFENLEKIMKLADKNMSFIGPFRVLREGSEVNGVELIMTDRDETDLPEMQTFLKCSHGKFSFWRDTPSEKNPVIVFSDIQGIPVVTVVGNTVEHAIYGFCNKISKLQDNSKEIKSAIAEILGLLGAQKMEKEVNQVMKKRKKETIMGVLGPGPGLLVGDFPNTKKSRYRAVSKESNIENLLRCLSNTGKQHQDAVIGEIDALMNDVMMYNDEGFYGNGLELGHVLFLSNQKSITNQVLLVLTTAYNLYGRTDFVKILELSMELRDH